MRHFYNAFVAMPMCWLENNLNLSLDAGRRAMQPNQTGATGKFYGAEFNEWRVSKRSQEVEKQPF